jgi:hypothetical protein
LRVRFLRAARVLHAGCSACPDWSGFKQSEACRRRARAQRRGLGKGEQEKASLRRVVRRVCSELCKRADNVVSVERTLYLELDLEASDYNEAVRKEYVYTVHVPHTLHDTVLHRPHDCADGAHARAAPSDTPSRVQARLRRRRRRLSLSSPQETGSRRSSDPLKAARYSGRAASSLSSPPTTTRGRGSELALTPGEAASAAGRAAHAAPLPPPAAGL